jgi:c-di-AMP phosphodiesterase-like protein
MWYPPHTTGRARNGLDFINFDEIWGALGGGGHRKAAAANIKFDDPEVVGHVHVFVAWLCV